MSGRSPKRTEDDLRAAFQLAAQESPSADDVLARVRAAERGALPPPRAPRRSVRFGRWAPIAAAAAVIIAVAVPVAISAGSHSGRSTSSSAGGAAQDKAAAPVEAGPGFAASSSAAGSVAGGPLNTDIPAHPTPSPSAGPSAGHICTPAEVSVAISWQVDGTQVSGQVTATNTTAAACDLLVKPSVTPLGLDGQPMNVQQQVSLEQKIGPSRLLPGASASAPISWKGTCGFGGKVRVNWGTGDVEVSAPSTGATCSLGGASTLTTGWFDPLS